MLWLTINPASVRRLRPAHSSITRLGQWLATFTWTQNVKRRIQWIGSLTKVWSVKCGQFEIQRYLMFGHPSHIAARPSSCTLKHILLLNFAWHSTALTVMFRHPWTLISSRYGQLLARLYMASSPMCGQPWGKSSCHFYIKSLSSPLRWMWWVSYSHWTELTLLPGSSAHTRRYWHWWAEK